jgi:glycosyltransferase involved in cell wall biosynthesis
MIAAPPAPIQAQVPAVLAEGEERAHTGVVVGTAITDVVSEGVRHQGAGRAQREGPPDMKPGKMFHLLFAAYMAGGNATILQNLEEQVRGRTDVESAWLRIEMDDESQKLNRRPRRHVIPGTIRNSLVTGARIHEIERAGGHFDAAYFFQHTICTFLWQFRARVPYLIAMDGTPLWYAKNDLWYAQPHFDPHSLASKVKRELTRRVYDHAFHLLPLSWSCRQSLIEDYGIPPERITVVPPGINLHRYVCPDRSTQGNAGRPLNLLFVGADFRRKGGDLLVKLAGERAFRDVRFHFVTKAYEGPAADNILVYDNLTTNSDPMVRLFAEADLFVLPTRADSHAIASLEAMATGLPVISTPVGGVVDVVEDGVTGYLVPKDDLAALAERITRLRYDRDLRHRMGIRGRERVESRFNAETIASTVVDLLERAADAHA